jgi:hypothetical protein
VLALGLRGLMRIYRLAMIGEPSVQGSALDGAILAPGKRTVSSALKAMSLDQQKRFHRLHRVLSRAVWSSGGASGVLSDLLVETFMPEAPLAVGVDETLERRKGKKISAKGTGARCVPLTAAW